MDLDACLVRGILDGGRKALLQVQSASITENLIIDEKYRNVFSFIVNHSREHGDVPSPSFVFEKTGVNIDISQKNEDKFTVYIDEIKNRQLWIMQKDVLKHLNKTLGDRNPKEGHLILNNYLKESRQANLGNQKVSGMFDFTEQVRQRYIDAKNGVSGIPSPWGSLNDMTFGFQPGQLVLVVARTGVGKTWCLLIMAKYCRDHGYLPLFVSAEMGKVPIASRYCALELGYSYDDIWNGRLSDLAEPTFFSKLESLQKDGGIDITGDGFDSTIDGVEEAIATSRPDIVFLDGMYLITSGGKDRHSMVSNTADQLKRISLQYNVPIIASHQFNREVDMNDPSTIRLENIGISDVLAWNSDIVLALIQTEEMRSEREMGIRPLKIRDGHVKDDILIRWDFQRMLFSETNIAIEEFSDEAFSSFQNNSSKSDKVDLF